MAPRYILDTNICIYIAKKRPPVVAEKFAQLTVGEVGMTLTTYGELIFGAEKSQQPDKALAFLAELISLIPVLLPDERVGQHYGEVRACLQKAGAPIGNNDLWIAAHALALEATLVTNNTREFERVAGLKVENWVS